MPSSLHLPFSFVCTCTLNLITSNYSIPILVMISNFLCSSVVIVVMVITGDGDVFLSNDGETVTSRGGDTDTE